MIFGCWPPIEVNTSLTRIQSAELFGRYPIIAWPAEVLCVLVEVRSPEGQWNLVVYNNSGAGSPLLKAVLTQPIATLQASLALRHAGAAA